MTLGFESLFLVVVSMLLLLSFLYYLAYEQIKKYDINLKIVFIFFIIFSATLLFLWPIGSIDMISYIYHSRILIAHGANPFFETYNNFPHDEFFYIIKNMWSGRSALNGPAFIISTSLLTFAAGNNFPLVFFLFKAFLVTINILNGWLVYKIFKNKIAFFLYAWNPLILFEFALNGHSDVMLILFLLLSFYFVFQKKQNIKNYSLGWLFLLLSVATKFITIVLLPIYYLITTINTKNLKEKIYYTLSAFIILLAVFFIIYFPFLDGPELFTRIINHSDHHDWNVKFSSFVIFWSTITLKNLSINDYMKIGPLVGKITLILGYLYIMFDFIKNWKKQTIKKIFSYSLFAMFLLYMTVFTWLMPWFYCLLIVLIISKYALYKKEKYVYYIMFLTIFGSLYYLIIR